MAELRFVPATRHQMKLRAAIFAPSGGGKTYTALTWASVLGDKVGVIDSEQGKAAMYAHRFSFDHLVMPDTEVDTYVDALALAQEIGCDVCVIDSASHEWTAGILGMVDRLKTGGEAGGMNAWRVASPKHEEFIAAITRSNMHVIACIRAKMQYEVSEEVTDGGRKRMTVQRLGVGPIQRDNFEYEFDLVCEMTSPENNLIVHKSRIETIPQGLTVENPDADLAIRAITFLNEGAAVELPPAAEKKDVDALRASLTRGGLPPGKDRHGAAGTQARAGRRAVPGVRVEKSGRVEDPAGSAGPEAASPPAGCRGVRARVHDRGGLV